MKRNVKEQKFTSADTSINEVKLPAIYNRNLIPSESIVLDYGCGKYVEHIEKHCNALGIEYHYYDKFNQPETSNKEQLSIVEEKRALGHRVFAVCSNVLNVIQEDEIILSILEDMRELATDLRLTVYEGNKSGQGRVTKKDCYQRMQCLREYIPYVEQAGWKVIKVTKNTIIAE